MPLLPVYSKRDGRLLCKVDPAARRVLIFDRRGGVQVEGMWAEQEHGETGYLINDGGTDTPQGAGATLVGPGTR
jgi:hypothetical protein